MPDTLQTQSKQSCNTCIFWEHNRRGRNCREHRKLKSRSVPGTPAEYWCKEYSPLAVAKCGDCRFWVDERLPRKKGSCSELGLVDGRGRERSADSTFCPSFGQRHAVTLADNPTIRVNGALSTVMDINTHSEPHSILIRSDECSGLLLEWVPNGPGKGEWKVAPVALTEPDAGKPRITGHQAEPKAAEVALFDGNVMVGGHEWRGQNSSNSRDSLDMLRIQVTSKRKRGVAMLSETGGVIETPSASTVQDEPWGPDWEDLREQMQNLLDSGTGASTAATNIRKRYEKDRGKRLGTKTGLRLEAQLKIEFRESA